MGVVSHIQDSFMKTVDEIGLLEAFESLEKYGNLKNASESLGISRSAVSRRIRLLEKRFKYPFFYRNEEGFKLTEAGIDFAPRVREVLRNIRNVTKFSAQNIEQYTSLCISAPYSLGITLLIPWIAEFRRLYPLVRVNLDFTLGPQKILSPVCDIRFSHGAIPSERVLSYSLGAMPRLIAASPKYLEQYGLPKNPSDLLCHSLLGAQDLSVNDSYLLKRGDEIVRLPFRSQIRTNDHISCKEAAKAGLGIGLHILQHDSVHELQKCELIEVLPNWHPEPCPINLLIPLSHPTNKIVEDFVDFIRTAWERHPILLSSKSEVQG